MAKDNHSDKFESLAPSAQMMSLLEHSSRSTIILDKEFRILWFNAKASKDMYSFFEEELKPGASYWDYVEMDTNKRFIRNFNATLQGRTLSIEQHITETGQKDSEVWIDGRFSPLKNEDNEIAGVIYSYSNISDRKKAEQDNAQTQLVAEAINRNTTQGFILISEENLVVDCNELATELVASNENAKACSGKKLEEVIHPYWVDEFMGGLTVARAGGDVSIEFEKPGPKSKTIEVRFTPVKDRLGKHHLVSVWAYDITGKIEAEQQLRRSEANLKAVFNSSSQTFYLLDRKLNILTFNEAAKLQVKTRFNVDLVEGMNVLDITTAENLVQFRVETERAFSGRKVHVEKHFVIDGKDFWFDRHLNPVKDASGKVDRITMWSIDITERKMAEKALKENESKFRKLASLLPVGIYQMDASGNTTYINESLQVIFGLKMVSLLAGEWTKNIHSDDASALKKTWNDAAQKREVFSMEYRYVKPNGNTIHIMEQAQPLFNHIGEYTGFLGTVIDVTEQKQNQELLQEKQIAEKSLKFRSDFLASMSHEIRTPLNGIMGMSELLLDTKLNSNQKSKLENILGASKDLRSIVNDVLNLSELEAGKVVLNKEQFQVSDLLEMVEERFSPEADAKNLELRFESPDKLMIDTDRRRITQVLSNLVRNAIKFTAEGSVRVSAETNNNGKLVFKITDTGPGIPKKEQAKLFQDFSQLEHTTAQNLEGTGLGLSICKKLIALLGGEIGMESEVGKGSTFWFSIPVAEPIANNSKNGSSKPKGKTQKQNGDVRVLLVEDNLINQQAFKVMLKKIGCKVDVLSNGKQAVERFSQDKYDLVFMDIQMPEMDGLEATTLIKKNHNKVPPIIGLSGNIIQRDDEGNLKSDMDDLLLKPVVSSDIERMIKKWV